MENNLKNLLEKLYENLSFDSKSEKSGFNIFSVLGVENKEVIICRFLGEILDPCGSHGLGTFPLEFFVKDVIGNVDFTAYDASHSKVLLEVCIDNSRRVDIVIYTEKQKYPIEVKIWAGDQDAQLYDYYKYFFGNDCNKQIFYLTPDGREPSKTSKGNLTSDNVKCLSFETHIRLWIEKILERINIDDPNTKTSLLQFKDILDEMRQNNMKLDAIEKVLGLNDSINYSDELKAAVVLLQKEKVLYERIKIQYLKDTLLFDKKAYILIECNDEDRKQDSHALLKIVPKDRPDTTVVWICVHENLYMVCTKLKKEAKDWIESNKTYSWRYIKPADYKGKKYNMSNEWKVEYIDKMKKIEIDSYLSDVDLSDN